MNRAYFVFWILCLVLEQAVWGERSSARPNVVLILADDLGYGDAGCYNPHSLVPTPHIDRLAREGTRFTDAHSSSGICTPTRYGLLTGRYSWRTPLGHALVMPYGEPLIDPNRPTIATMFQQQGYVTGCVGKWHLGLRYPTQEGARGYDNGRGYTQIEAHIDWERDLTGGPCDHGFDYFFGSAGCCSSDPPYSFIENRRTIGIPRVVTPKAWNILPGFYPGLKDDTWELSQVDVELTKKAVGFIDGHAGKRQPFFLYFALNTPHVPWVVPDYLEGTSGIGPYGDMILLADRAVERVYTALQRNGILDNTIVIFTSDNGPQNNTIYGHRSAGPLKGHKNTVWEAGHRVPFVVRWPGHVKAGAASSQLLCLTDMYATFAEFLGCGLPAAGAEDSFPVWSAIVGPTECERPGMINDDGRGDWALRQEGWKFIRLQKAASGGTRLLFNMKEDPYEDDNLFDREPARATQMEKLLDELIACNSSRQYLSVSERSRGRK